MNSKLITSAAAGSNALPPPSKIHKIHTFEDPHSSHSLLITQWFGLKSSPHHPAAALPQLPPITPGQILLITGPSGSGKSTLLRRLRRRGKIPLVKLPRLPRASAPVIDLFPHLSIESALA